MTKAKPEASPFVLDWSHAIADVPGKGLDITRSATLEETQALAADFGILGIERLQARYKITSAGRDRYKLSGQLTARVVQACVVTLDPVPADITTALSAEFRAPGDLPDSEDEQSALDAVEHEPIEGNRIATGRIVQETLLAALPPYPRSPDAALDRAEAGPSADEAKAGASSPFAGLAALKPKT